MASIFWKCWGRILCSSWYSDLILDHVFYSLHNLPAPPEILPRFSENHKTETGHLLKAGCALCSSSLSAFAAPNEALPASSVNCYSLLQPQHTYAGLHCLSQEAIAGGYSSPGNSPGLRPPFAHSSSIPSKLSACLHHWAAVSSCSSYLPGIFHSFCLPVVVQRSCVLFILYECECEEWVLGTGQVCLFCQLDMKLCPLISIDV